MKSDDLSESSEAIAGAPPVGSVAPTPEVPGGPRSPLAKNVHQALRAQIVAGQLRPEQKLLGEHELAAAFLVSRPIVREALRLLREEGLIYSRRGAGSFVVERPGVGAPKAAIGFAPVETIADIQRCYDFRLTIEPDHAYWAAQRWNAAALDDIAAQPAPLDQRLDRLIAAIVESVDASTYFLPIFLREIADGGVHLSPDELGRIAAIFATVTGVIAEGGRQKVFRPIHPALAHFTLIGPLIMYRASAPVRARVKAVRRVEFQEADSATLTEHLQMVARRMLAIEKTED